MNFIGNFLFLLEDAATCLIMISKHSLLVTGSESGIVRFFDFESQSPVKPPINAHKGKIATGIK